MTDENLEPRQDDSQWVELAKIGDTAAFDRLVELYHSRIYTLTYQMTSNREDAEDLTQEIFVRRLRLCLGLKGGPLFIRGFIGLGLIKRLIIGRSA